MDNPLQKTPETTIDPPSGEGIDRRKFLVRSLAAGFALAVQPISAETIVTPADGLVAGEVQIPTSDVLIPGYAAMRDTGGPFPTVLVVHEIFGVHEHIKDLCRRLGHLGFFAVAPELYVRQGDVSQLPTTQEIQAVVARVPDAQVLSDLDATAAWAASTGGADTSRLGITGFCWGGRIVWLYAAHNPNLDAAAAWYGPLGNQPGPLTPLQPRDIVTNLYAPVLGLYGGADPSIPVTLVDDMRARLLSAGKPGEIIVYPDAPHAFNADYRASYRRDAAENAWKRMVNFFRANHVWKNR